MGICLYMDLDNDKHCPFWFTKTDSKALVWYIAEVQSGAGGVPNVIGALMEQLEIDVQPLLKIAGQDFEIEELGCDEETYRKYQEDNQAAWQPPQELIDCLQGFLEKMDREPDIFARVYADIQVKDDFDYFQQGFFKQDLLDIIHMAEWAKENGAAHIRLLAA